MSKISDYLNFIKEKGKPVSEINSGSDELALTVDDALQAVELSRDAKAAVLGGDILSDELGKLSYAYQLWGSKYHYLNWYCIKKDNETQTEYNDRSCDIAMEAINKADTVAKKLGKSCYIVIVA